MNAADIVGYTIPGEAYCVHCVERGDYCPEREASPIFASQEGWGDLSCGVCLHTLACSFEAKACGRCKAELRKAREEAAERKERQARKARKG